MPGPLTTGAVGEIVRERFGAHAEPAFVEVCHSSTAGNPLLLEELLKTLIADRLSYTAA